VRAPWRRGNPELVAGRPRLLVPFAGGELDSVVLAAALRIARADGAVVVPAYLLVVPLEFGLDAPVQNDELETALPILEAVELAARRERIPVDARVERGRSPIDALRRLWEIERFDRVIVPSRGAGAIHPGFSSKDVAWMLDHAPGEVLVLRPAD
jgi:nucleotide-binding universal stress UspA family protein